MRVGSERLQRADSLSGVRGVLVGLLVLNGIAMVLGYALDVQELLVLGAALSGPVALSLLALSRRPQSTRINWRLLFWGGLCLAAVGLATAAVTGFIELSAWQIAMHYIAGAGALLAARGAHRSHVG